MQHTKTMPQMPKTAEINMADPDWVCGFADGNNAVWGSAPDMRRGHTYAHGWLTGRLCQEPPSLKRH